LGDGGEAVRVLGGFGFDDVETSVGVLGALDSGAAGAGWGNLVWRLRMWSWEYLTWTLLEQLWRHSRCSTSELLQLRWKRPMCWGRACREQWQECSAWVLAGQG